MTHRREQHTFLSNSRSESRANSSQLNRSRARVDQPPIHRMAMGFRVLIRCESAYALRKNLHTKRLRVDY